MAKVRVEVHLTPAENNKVIGMAAKSNRSRKNMCEHIIRERIKREENGVDENREKRFAIPIPDVPELQVHTTETVVLSVIADFVRWHYDEGYKLESQTPIDKAKNYIKYLNQLKKNDKRNHNK